MSDIFVEAKRTVSVPNIVLIDDAIQFSSFAYYVLDDAWKGPPLVPNGTVGSLSISCN